LRQQMTDEGYPHSLLPIRPLPRPRLIPATNLPLTSFGVCSNATLRNKLPTGLMEPSLNHLMAYSLTRPSALVRPDYKFWTPNPAAQEFPA
jgi:hypothetical protein